MNSAGRSLVLAALLTAAIACGFAAVQWALSGVP